MVEETEKAEEKRIPRCPYQCILPQCTQCGSRWQIQDIDYSRQHQGM